jgi:hypothetical protein
VFDAGNYRGRWERWVKDPLIERAGLTFDRTPAGRIVAPEGKVRVCAWHIDFDERPTCFLDVASEEEARFVCANLAACCGGNIDYATAHDDAGATVVARPY